MGEATPQQIGQLTDLAERLNDFSKQTDDPVYAALFAKAAAEILQQARSGLSKPDFPQNSQTSNLPVSSPPISNPFVTALWDPANGCGLSGGATSGQARPTAC